MPSNSSAGTGHSFIENWLASLPVEQQANMRRQLNINNPESENSGQVGTSDEQQAVDLMFDSEPSTIPVPPAPPAPPSIEEYMQAAESSHSYGRAARTRTGAEASWASSRTMARGRGISPAARAILNGGTDPIFDEDTGIEHYPTGGQYTLSGNVEVSEEMTTVAQVFGQRATYPTIENHPLIVGTNLAGIEIELENLRVRAPRFNYWEAKSDGSLRNGGMEFVCSSPWGGRDLYNAAIEIDGYLFGNNPDGSWRCSTHVHVDVRNMTAPQVKRMILAYIVYERILFKCSGWHRYKNNFCVALGFAQEQLAILSRNWELPDSQFLSNVASQWDKYSSMNLVPMQSFGSIEFRISEAKWRKGKLIRLANRFLSLKELAMNFEGTDEAFVEYLMTIPINQAIRKGLPKTLPPESQEDLEIGYKLAHDVISMAKIRRRLIYTHVVNLEDGTRRMPFQINARYWDHIRSHVRHSSDGCWLLPERRVGELTFGWLYELKEKCREWGITFDSDWFEPESNARQYRQLFSTYCSEQSRGEVPMPVSRDEDDEDEDDDDNSPEW